MHPYQPPKFKHIGIVDSVVMLVLVAVVAGALYFVAINPPDIELRQQPVEARILTNKDGEKWREPVGRQVFHVAQSEGYWPKFVEVEVNPADVIPGDIQYMRVVLEDDVAIEKVVAEIERDHGFHFVELELTERRAVTEMDEINKPYKVVNDKLSIAKTPTPQEVMGVALRSLLGRAHATGLERFVYEGKWAVFDTHTTTYKTKFTATDILGRETSDTIGWSDPCAPPVTGDWTMINEGPPGITECIISRIDGVQNGNFGTNGRTLTLAAPSIFVFSSGNFLAPSADFNTSIPGFINVAPGAQIRQSTLVVCDRDEDDYIYAEELDNQKLFLPKNLAGTGTECDIADAPIASKENNFKKFLARVFKGRVFEAVSDLFLDGKTQAAEPGGGTGPGKERWIPRATIRGVTGGVLLKPDCYDGSKFAYPGNPEFYRRDRGDGGYDYNCDYTITEEYETFGSPFCEGSVSCPSGYRMDESWDGSGCGAGHVYPQCTNTACTIYNFDYYNGCR